MRMQIVSALGALALLLPLAEARAADYGEGFEMPAAPYVPAQYYGDDDNGPYGNGFDRPDYDRPDYDRPGYDRPDYYRPVPPPPVRRYISCWRGSRILERQGFYRVRMSDCEAPVYQFRALRDGRRYLVRMSARTGRVLAVIRIRTY